MNEFIRNEAASKDTIDVKRVYIAMCEGNLYDAVLLSQIIYWHLPDKDGKSKLRVEKEGDLWLAKTDKDWYDEIAMNEHTARKARNRLVKRGLIESKVWRFNSLPTCHIRINWDVLLPIYNAAMEELYRTSDPKRPERTKRNVLRGRNETSLEDETLTETTTETTTESTCFAVNGQTFTIPVHWSSFTLSNSWIEKNSAEYIQEKIDYVASQELKSPITSPVDYLKCAIEGNWSENKTNGQAKAEMKFITAVCSECHLNLERCECSEGVEYRRSKYVVALQ